MLTTYTKSVTANLRKKALAIKSFVFLSSMSELLQNIEFEKWISELKSKIRATQTKVALSLNNQLIELYWEIGRNIVTRQKTQTGEVNL